MVRLEGVGRRFGNKWAVRALSLEVARGEVFGLLGPNAAGKTTTIKMMTGLLEPTEGSIIIDGHNLAAEPVVAKSKVGYIPDRAFFYEKLTVKEFLFFVSSIYDVNKHHALPRIEGLVERFGIKDFEDSLIETCSQGVRQRLLFVAALVHEPTLLIIDEPFVGLDPFGVSLVMDAMRGLAASGTAIFLATHSLHIAQKVCDRVGLIDGGTLVALKKRDEIMNYDGGLETLFMSKLGRTE